MISNRKQTRVKRERLFQKIQECDYLQVLFLFIFWPPCRPGMSSKSQLPPKLQLRQCWIVNLLCWIRDPCLGPGIKPTSQGSQNATDPVVPQQETHLQLKKKKIFFFRAAPAACESSWARGQIGYAAGVCTTASAMPDPSYELHCGLQQQQILNQVRPRDQTHILTDTILGS